jgi:long-chain acyl-CoA synthetase
VTRINRDLAPPERVRRFVIAAEPFTLDNAQLTPTLKIRRHAIRAAYQDAFDSLYDGKGMAA